jgi:hypothetical protein
MAAKQQPSMAAATPIEAQPQQKPQQQKPLPNDPLATVKTAAEHIVAVITATEPFKSEIKSKGKVVNLVICFDEAKDSKLVVRRRHIMPTEWQLDAKELALVSSVIYDIPTAKATIRLVKRAQNDRAVVAAQDRCWEETVFGFSKLDPRSLSLPVSGIECTKDDTHLQELVKRIVKELVSVATQRDEEVKARITVFSREYMDDPHFVIAISGLRAIGPLTFAPSRWSDGIPLTIRETLSMLFRIDDTDKSKRVNELRIAIKEDTLKKLHEVFPKPDSPWPSPPPLPPLSHQPPPIDMKEIMH